MHLRFENLGGFGGLHEGGRVGPAGTARQEGGYRGGAGGDRGGGSEGGGHVEGSSPESGSRSRRLSNSQGLGVGGKGGGHRLSCRSHRIGRRWLNLSVEISGV